MKILGIETSCDETAIGVVEDGVRMLSSVVSSQVELHATYGGVVPELASRQHVEAIIPVLDEALDRASCSLQDIDAVAVTYGPGLAGALLVGFNFAKALAYAHGLPLVPVNHLEGHVYAAWLDREEGPEFPALVLIVSGGHSDVVLMEGHGRYRRLGQTVDDAAGEAFDKVARLLGLGFPGGPLRSTSLRRARSGAQAAARAPRPPLRLLVLRAEDGCRGRRNPRSPAQGPPRAALRLVAQDEGAAHRPRRRGRGAGRRRAGRRFPGLRGRLARHESGAGSGRARRAAGDPLRRRRREHGLRAALAERSPAPLLVPPPALCTDNGAMIAACAHYRLAAGDIAPLDLDIAPGLRIG